MTDSSISNFLKMGSDIGNLDPKGLEEFKKAFSNTLTPPNNITKSAETAVTRIFGIALSSVIVVVGLIIIGMLIWGIFTGFINLMTALGIIVLVLVSCWLGYLFFMSMMEKELSDISGELRSHVGEYSENIFEEILLALNNGVSAYVKERPSSNLSEFTEEELDTPID